MKNLFDIGRQDNQPILSPLGKQAGLADRVRVAGRSLPPAAAPIAFTVVGGIALVVALSAILGGTPPQTVEDTAAAEPPAMAAAVPETPPVEEQAEEPALDTAGDMTDPAPAVLAVDTGADTPDLAQTSSILAVAPTERALRPSVEIAESEEEIAVLEAIQRQEVEEDIGAVQIHEAAATASGPAPTAAALQAATTNNYVNLRAGPSDDAEVLMVVPANAAIEAEADCNWCSVAYDGQQGYIYRTFIAY